MDCFQLLEQKIQRLVAEHAAAAQRAAELQAECEVLRAAKVDVENQAVLLKEHIESLEQSLLQFSKKHEELDQERQLTKMVVDDLIKSIDSLMNEEAC